MTSILLSASSKKWKQEQAVGKPRIQKEYESGG